MQSDEFNWKTPDALPDRSVLLSMGRGARGACPNCGVGKVFAKGLSTRTHCSHCNEELHHHRADDLPAYLNIFIVGHIVVGLAVILMDMKLLGTWEIVFLACLVALGMAVLLMRPLKGMVLGAQWALRMHGFGGHDD